MSYRYIALFRFPILCNFLSPLRCSRRVHPSFRRFRVSAFPRFLSEKTSRGDQRDSRDHQQNFMRQHEQTEYDYARSDQEHSQSRSVFLLFSAGPFPFSSSHIPVSSLISCRRFPSVPVEGENPAMLPRNVSDKRLR